MPSISNQHIPYRMVPLICQALTVEPDNVDVWLDGLRLLRDPKLKAAMGQTSSIWLPLLLKALDVARPVELNLSALRLLADVAEAIEPIKQCLVKPLRMLAGEEMLQASEELEIACLRLGIKGEVVEGREVGSNRSTGYSSLPSAPALLPTPAQTQTPVHPRNHPILSQIVDRNLPEQWRTVENAWTATLLSPPTDEGSTWLADLYQATLEASAVLELVLAVKNLVDDAIVGLFSKPGVSQQITNVFLELVAFCGKESIVLPEMVTSAASGYALNGFEGTLADPIPAITLWYAELDTAEDFTDKKLAKLVEKNIRYGTASYDAAWSTLLWLRDDYNHQPDPMWITSLSHWDAALQAQEKLDKESGIHSFASFNTQIVCHHALGQWEEGHKLASTMFEGLEDSQKSQTAYWAIASAWHMGDYSAMADYIAFQPKGTTKSLYKAITDIYHQQYASAFHHLSKAQTLCYDELQYRLNLGPKESLKALAKAELLVELQEAITYKSQPDERKQILSNWRARFKRSHADPSSWLKRLEVWTLACHPKTKEISVCYLECAKLCNNKGMHKAAARLIDLLEPEEYEPGCQVQYTKFRLAWHDAVSKQDLQSMAEVQDSLICHTSTFISHLGLHPEDFLGPLSSVKAGAVDQLKSLNNKDVLHPLSRRFLRLGQCLKGLHGEGAAVDIHQEVLKYYALAHNLQPSWHDASWSMAATAISIYEAGNFAAEDIDAVDQYVTPSIQALLYTLNKQTHPERVIRCLLRLVTLWFRYGEYQSVTSAIRATLDTAPLHSWLNAIPQLIARLGNPHQELQMVLVALLKKIAGQYPHAIIWPLLTASQTGRKENESAAKIIMDYICTLPDGAMLVHQARLVGKELIRSSNSWLEKWRLLTIPFLPHKDIMEIPWQNLPAVWSDHIAGLSHPETPDEEQFVQQYGLGLVKIYNLLSKYEQSRQIDLVNMAYSELYKLFGEFETQLATWKHPGMKLYLSSVAPKLLTIKDCIIIVPGKYDANLKLDSQAFIDSFQPSLEVVASKQLPRKLVLRSYKENFTFLLKGNEDLRGDERIMQLFTLINTLLNHDTTSFGMNLHLLPYEVIPLSPNAGLVSWVPNTQQLQTMIAQHREKTGNAKLNQLESAALFGVDANILAINKGKIDITASQMEAYDKLPLAKKEERLKAALALSKQNDLKDLLWGRSPNADVWLRRRTNFSRTVGVSSFVGHIIGLGDRHGANILVDQLTWGVVHIDFGDLFNVAQERDMQPEKVPFRLTRMMTNAMELATWAGHAVPASRGAIKPASTATMTVLRLSQSSLLAMLEAFLYDPLLAWDNDLTASATTAATENLTTPQASPGAQHSPLPTVIGQQPDPHPLLPPYAGQWRDTNPYMAKVAGAMTNAKALKVLADIERKLMGYEKGSKEALSAGKQVQHLIAQATDLKNLAQGYVLGWMPQW